MSSGSGIGWQVDLPGLSALVLNVGAAGLKRFAQAGVDVHTLICMGEIAQVCPACPEFRKQISLCRQEQREQKIWLYKAIEIGTSSNFIADELLKRQAGENIIALMSAILPFAPRNECEMLLLRLFEAMKKDAEATPGFGQLQAFCDSLLSLAQKIPFKDKVFQYFKLLEPFSKVSMKTRDAIPSHQTFVQLITTFLKMASDDRKPTLVYKGIEGAAWVIAYARHVMGLPVCVLETRNTVIPVNGNYKDSRVRVCIFETQPGCELLSEGVVHDFFVPESLQRVGGNCWTVDLTLTNLANLYLPADPQLKKAIAQIVRSMSINFTSLLAYSFGPEVTGLEVADVGFIGYTTYCLPQVLRRTSRNLDVMGFQRVDDTNVDENTWTQYLQPVLDAGHTQAGHLRPGSKWLDSKLGYSTDYDLTVSNSDIVFNAEGLRIINFACMIIQAASWLAFTNWADHLRTISTSFLDYNASGGNALYFDRPVVDLVHYWSRNQSLDRNRVLNETPDSHSFTIDGNPLLRAVVELAIYDHYPGQKQIPDKIVPKPVLALAHHGVIMHCPAASRQHIDFDAEYIQLLPGQIRALGERHEAITGSTDFHPIEYVHNVSDSSLIPRNQLPPLAVKSEAHFARNSVIIELTLNLIEQVYSLKNHDLIDNGLANHYVTNGCHHSYYREAPILQIIVQQGIWVNHVTQAIDDTGSYRINQVDQNQLGQWLATSGKPRPGRKYILQRDTCMECTLSMIVKLKESGFWERDTEVIITPGRLEGEPMD